MMVSLRFFLPLLVLLASASLRGRADESRQIPGPRRRLQTPQDYVQKALAGYYTNAQMGPALRDFVRRCGSIARLSTIGRSVRGVPLWVLEITEKPRKASHTKPNFKYVANMHGDETGGRQLLIAFAEYLCANRKTDPLAGRLVKELRLFLLPSMNPDGFEARTRENSNGVDLNRDFPDPIFDPQMLPSGLEQPETKAVMAWSLAKGFTASANMHEGALCVNYPYDATAGGEVAYNTTKDDATFRHISLAYAQHNTRMSSSVEFPQGITNGAAWYSVYGGMQDWNYVAASCFETTLELFKVKGRSNLTRLLEDNLESLLQYALVSTLGGVRGRVQAQGSNGTFVPLTAEIRVLGGGAVVRTRPGGTYFRPLAPGEHTIVASAPGYATQEAVVLVPEDDSGVVQDFLLSATGA